MKFVERRSGFGGVVVAFEDTKPFMESFNEFCARVPKVQEIPTFKVLIDGRDTRVWLVYNV